MSPFKKSEPLDRAVRRICRQHISLALNHLRRSKPAVAVHAVRKEIQKLRAVFRLVRGEISPAHYRQTVKALRHAAKLLAAPRDARVMLKTFEQLAGPAADQKFPEMHQALQKHRRQALRRFRDAEAMAAAKVILKKTNRRVTQLEFAVAGWPTLASGLWQSYTRGQRDYEFIGLQSSPEQFHAWRKRAKIFRDQLRLFAPNQPLPADPLLSGLTQITDVLGEDHDLFLLGQFVSDRCGGQGTAANQLQRLIRLRQKKLRADALQLGARLFGKKPAAVCARLEQQWHSWYGQAVSR